ncbi:serine protease snake [Stomoxys calcitrans]|uniref:Peptidase S1 domain-containing protein n=1 Tax=Stomoxys calcitrans TaxID=35570 RepID=A0A1I8NWZ9_STOCA|nr:serine protease snake [Stomoxys calcitrans]
MMLIERMRKQHYKKLLILAVLLAGFCEAQDQNEIRCTRYKKQLYEKDVSVSFFFPGAEPQTITADRCMTVAPLVVGGENAQAKEFPFAALLGSLETTGDNVNWFCGGTIISQNLVLTAAHCFYSSLGAINRVRLGELDFNSLTDDANPEDFLVQQLIEHPSYRRNEPYNDIGLVLLGRSISFNSYKQPACLPSLDIIEENSDSLVAIGWGHTKFSGQASSHLQKVELKPYSYENCAALAATAEGAEILPSGLWNSILCAGSSEAKDTCQGDSGGPLLLQHPRFPCMKIVVGITSTGFSGCATPDIPSLYTRVRHYLDWINSYIN